MSQVTREEFETLMGRVAASETLLSISLVTFLSGVTPENRADVIGDLMVAFEDSVQSMPVACQRAAIETAERVLSNARKNLEQGEKGQAEHEG